MQPPTLGYSTYEDDKDKTKSGQRKHNTTYKKKSKKATTFIRSLPLPKEDDPDSESDDEIGADYSPENNPGSSIKPNSIESSILQEGLDQRKKYDAEQKDYSNQYIGTQQNVPYYSQLLNSSSLQSSNESDLMKKLNYVVHLLEEQHDEKTGSVTEELVLYMFLGVFVIFIVDSFSRTSKYKR